MLLIQVRGHAVSAEAEQRCVLARCRLAPAQLKVWNVVQQPGIDLSVADDVDAVILGGAGAHSVTERYDFTAPLREVVSHLLEDDRPFFGSCWGHQFLGEVLGGKVETDEVREEVGTFDAILTAAGRSDPLTAELPERFAVQLGHKDQIVVPPPGLEVLATTERCPFQLVRVAGKPAYGSQFHSEMSIDDMKARVRVYSHYLKGGAAAIAAFEAALRPSPEADGLLDRFLTLYA